MSFGLKCVHFNHLKLWVVMKKPGVEKGIAILWLLFSSSKIFRGPWQENTGCLLFRHSQILCKYYANVQIYSVIINKIVVSIGPLTLLRMLFRIWIQRAPRKFLPLEMGSQHSKLCQGSKGTSQALRSHVPSGKTSQDFQKSGNSKMCGCSSPVSELSGCSGFSRNCDKSSTVQINLRTRFILLCFHCHQKL